MKIALLGAGHIGQTIAALLTGCGDYTVTVSPRAARTVQLRLQALPELRQLCSVSGEFDFLALLRAPGTARLDALLDEIGQIEGVTRTHTSVVLAVRIDRRA